MIIKIIVDEKDIYSQKGWTILKALSYFKIEIPNLCDYKLDNDNINNNLSFVRDEKELNCKLCLIKVKRKNEESYNLKYACNEIVENGMDIISEDEEIVSYRKALLNSIFYSHNAVCLNCKVDYNCKLKKYFDLYNITAKNSEENNKEKILSDNKFNNKFVNEIKDIVKTFNLPGYIKADYDRCINCGLCANYKTINGYNSMIVDLCPTNVFYSKREFEKEIKNNSNNSIESVQNFCIGCNKLCDIKYLHNRESIIDIKSISGKKYGLCDYGRKMDYYSNDLLKYPLIHGVENDFEKAKELYQEFISDINDNSYLAIASTSYPLEDIKAFNELSSSLGITKLYYKKNNISTDSNVIRDNYTNINKYSIEELKRELKYINGENIDFDSYKKFIILGDSLLGNDEKIISFAQKNKRNYILFTPTLSLLAYNSFVAFPIAGLGEFNGFYIDKYGKAKETVSFLNKDKNRLNLRDLIKYLYL